MPYRNERSLLSNQPAKKQSLMSLAATAKPKDENKENVQNLTPSDTIKKDVTPPKKSKGEKKVEIIESTAIVNVISDETKKDEETSRSNTEAAKVNKKSEKETSQGKGSDSNKSSAKESPKSGGLCRSKADVDVRDSQTKDTQDTKTQEKATEEAPESKGPKSGDESKQASKSGGLCRGKGDVDVTDTTSNQPENNQQNSADAKPKKEDKSEPAGKKETQQPEDKTNDLSSKSGGFCKSKQDVTVTESISKPTDVKDTTSNQPENNQQSAADAKPKKEDKTEPAGKKETQQPEDKSKETSSKSGGFCKSKQDVRVTDSISKPAGEGKEKNTANKSSNSITESTSKPTSESEQKDEKQTAKGGGICRSKADVEVDDSLSKPSEQDQSNESEVKAQAEGKESTDKAKQPGKPSVSNTKVEKGLEEEAQKKESGGFCKSKKDVKVEDSLSTQQPITEEELKQVEASVIPTVRSDPVPMSKKAEEKTRGKEDKNKAMPQTSDNNAETKTTPTVKSGNCCGAGSVAVDESVRPMDKPAKEEAATPSKGNTSSNTNAPTTASASNSSGKTDGVKPPPAKSGIRCGARSVAVNDSLRPISAEDSKQEPQNTSVKDDSFGESIYRGLESIDGNDGASGSYENDKESAMDNSRDDGETETAQRKTARPLPKERLVKLEEEKIQTTEGQEKKKKKNAKVKTEKGKRKGDQKDFEEQEGLLGQDRDVEEDVYDEYPSDIVYVDPEPPPPMLKKARKTKKKKASMIF